MPSQYIQRVAEALFGSDSTLDQLFSWPGFSRLSSTEVEIPGEPATAVEYDRLSCGKLGSIKATGYLERLSPVLARLLRADRSVRSPEMTVHQGMVGENTLPVNEVDRPGSLFTVTTLEEYARCPYFTFLSTILHWLFLKSRKRCRCWMPARRIIIHRIVEKFTGLSVTKTGSPVRRYAVQCRGLLVNLCEEQLTRQAGSGLHHYPLLLDQVRRELMDILDSFLERESKEEEPWPAYLEVSFKCGAPGGPVVIDLPHGEEIALQGRIDRIDRADSRVRLIDYKTGKKRYKMKACRAEKRCSCPYTCWPPAVCWGWRIWMGRWPVTITFCSRCGRGDLYG